MSCDVTTPLSGTVCGPSPRTSYEVFTLTHYEDMEGDEKCKNWGVLGVMGHPRSSETSLFDRAHMTFYSTLIETIYLVPFSSYSAFFVESDQF